MIDTGWIDDLPEALGAQRQLLHGLVELCERDARVSWLIVGCSLARGAPDSLSDLDLAMGVDDEGPG